MATAKNCFCGEPNCWPESDYAWLDEDAGWRGQVNGCDTVIHWVHGKMIAEERHPPAVSLDLLEFQSRLAQWCEGLENPKILWAHTTGDDDPAALWIVSVRNPTAADWKRLRDVRMRQLERDRRELVSIQRRIAVNETATSS